MVQKSNCFQRSMLRLGGETDMSLRYPHLFSPLKINSIMVSNRIIANPMSQIYEDKALGRPGVVIAGSVITQPGKSSWASPDEPYAFSKYQVEKTRQRVLRAHQGGARPPLRLAMRDSMHGWHREIMLWVRSALSVRMELRCVPWTRP